jgi:hypothetical protein
MASWVRTQRVFPPHAIGWLAAFRPVARLCLALALALVLSCTGCQPRGGGAPPAAPTIDPDLSTLTRADVCVLARDALLRFDEQFPVPSGRKHYLTSMGDFVDVYQDSGIDLDTSSAVGEIGPEAFGDYATLPPRVRAFLLPARPARATPGSVSVYPLSVWGIVCSERERKVQITLGWSCTICASFTFLYRVEADGRLVFLHSLGMGCSSPGSRLIRVPSP